MYLAVDISADLMAALGQLRVRLADEDGGAGDVGGRHRGAGGLAVAEVLLFARSAGGVALGQDVDAGGGDVGEERQADAGAAAAEVADLVGRVAELEGHGVDHDDGRRVGGVGVDDRLAGGVADEDRARSSPGLPTTPGPMLISSSPPARVL